MIDTTAHSPTEAQRTIYAVWSCDGDQWITEHKEGKTPGMSSIEAGRLINPETAKIVICANRSSAEKLVSHANQ